MNLRITLLLLLFPLLNAGAQDIPASQNPTHCNVAGNYKGNFSGKLTGTWNATVNPYTGDVSINMVWDNNLAAGAGSITSTSEHPSAHIKFYEGIFEGVFKNFDEHNTASAFSGQWKNRQYAGDFRGKRISYPSATCHLYTHKTQ